MLSGADQKKSTLGCCFSPLVICQQRAFFDSILGAGALPRTSESPFLVWLSSSAAHKSRAGVSILSLQPLSAIMSSSAIDTAYRYFHVKVSAIKLPGKLRCDPLAVVYSGAPGHYTEIAKTRPRPNEWNPKFPETIALPADSDLERAAHIRVDFYNKVVSEDRFLGSANCQLIHIIQNESGSLALPLCTPDFGDGHPKARVVLTAIEGFKKLSCDSSKKVQFSFELAQTNFYGVSMKCFYDVSRAAGASWAPVLTSAHAKLDAQGWCQFPSVGSTLLDLVQEQPGTPLMINLYRYKVLGQKRLLGYVQFSIKDIVKMERGSCIPFIGNPRERLISADCSVEYAAEEAGAYKIGLKLVNVQWRAEEILPPEDGQV